MQTRGRHGVHARTQVALRALQVWEAVVQNEGDAAKPFVNNLLPFVVSAQPHAGRSLMRQQLGDRARAAHALRMGARLNQLVRALHAG